MKDFAEKPTHITSDYSLFLIRNPAGLNAYVLNNLHELGLKKGYIFTVERLFKGAKSALVIFAPKSVLERFTQLDLLELEDYTDKNKEQVLAWEVGVKDYLAFHLFPPAVSKDFPQLEESEQFWWQLTFQGVSGNLWPQINGKRGIIASMIQSLFSVIGIDGGDKNLTQNLKKLIQTDPQLRSIIETRNSQKVFNTQIRAVVFSSNEHRRIELASKMESIDSGKLLRLPKAYTSEQILSFYRERAKMAAGMGSVLLTSDEIIQLAK